MNVSWSDLNNAQKAGDYPFRDGSINVTFAEVAIWKKDPAAQFRLMRKHPIQGTIVAFPPKDECKHPSADMFKKKACVRGKEVKLCNLFSREFDLTGPKREAARETGVIDSDKWESIKSPARGSRQQS